MQWSNGIIYPIYTDLIIEGLAFSLTVKTINKAEHRKKIYMIAAINV